MSRVCNRKQPKSEALIAVDLFGLPARYRLIKKECEEYNLTLIEDAAQDLVGK